MILCLLPAVSKRICCCKNEKWLRKLISLLKVANNPEVAKSWSSFLYQANLLACYQERINSIHIISNYLLSKNSGYTLSLPRDADSVLKYALFTNQKNVSICEKLMQQWESRQTVHENKCGYSTLNRVRQGFSRSGKRKIPNMARSRCWTRPSCRLCTDKSCRRFFASILEAYHSW